MHFGVLGPLRVIADDGADITPRGLQQRQVLARLLVAAPNPVSIDAIEELLWRGPAPSTNALQAVISKLRRVIAPVRIDADGGGYALRGDYATDLGEHARLVARGDFAGAAALVRGEPFPELADDLASAPERAHLAGALRGSERKRMEALVAGATPLDAIAELEARVIAEPDDEGWWALLMRAQYRSGQQADALRSFQRARQSLSDRLGLSPGPELQMIEGEILAGRPIEGRRQLQLPARLSSFVGRDDDLAALSEATASHRLITLVGPGGTGKTSTALELARRQFGGDAAFVGLSPLTDRDGIVRALSRAIGLPDTEQAPRTTPAAFDEPLDRIVQALATASTTIVVDNCEHVIEPAAAIVHRLLVECASIRVIATSRSSLSVPGEHVYPLRPLPDADAVELLVQRAGDHAAGGAVADADPDLVRSLCERLDRLPLAIELAAARLRSMTVHELVDRLDDRFALLSSGPRTVEPRQQTLRAVVDWSHDLLDATEQIVFRRLAVFTGGGTADAVEFVAAGALADALPTGVVLPVIDRLVDKSLVRAERTPDGTRYSMLQTLHEYAAERLADSGEREAILVRHAQYYADLLRGAARGLVGHEQGRWLATIARERQNLEAGRATAIARQDAQLALELIAPIGWYFYMSGELDTGAEALADALACPGPTEPALRALALALYGWLVSNGSQVEQAVSATSEALAMIDRIDDAFVSGLIVNTHVMSMFFAGRVDGVRAMLPELERLAADPSDRWIAAVTKIVQGELFQYSGDTTIAERKFLEAAADFEHVGDMFAYALTITEASEIAELFGDYDRAAAYLERGIELAAQVGFSANPLAMRARLANVEILRGNLDVAAGYHRMLLDDVVAVGVPWLQAMALVGTSAIARRRGDWATAEDCLARAWALPRSQTVPYMRSIVLVAQGYLADQQGDAHRALELQLTGLRTAIGLATPRGLAYSFEGCAGTLAIAGDGSHAALAARLLGGADRLRRASGGAMPPGERFDVDRAESRLRATLGDRVFDAEFAAGAATSDEYLIAATLAI